MIRTSLLTINYIIGVRIERELELTERGEGRRGKTRICRLRLRRLRPRRLGEENARTRNFAGGMSQRDIDTFLRGGGNKAPSIKYFPKI